MLLAPDVIDIRNCFSYQLLTSLIQCIFNNVFLPLISYDGWADSPESCVHCGQADYQEGFGPRTLILCSSCGALGTHVACEEGATGIPIQEHHVRGMCEWHCSDACAAVARDLDRCVDQRFDVPFVEGVAGTEPGAEKKDKLTYEVAAVSAVIRRERMIEELVD